MKRIGLVGFFFLWASVAHLQAQNAQPKPSPLPPANDLIGPQLIMWSEMQEPQPVQSVSIPDPPAQGQERGPTPPIDSITMTKTNKPQSEKKSAAPPTHVSAINNTESAAK
jgi:hypothetical protein